MSHYRKTISNYMLVQPIFLAVILSLLTLGGALYLNSKRSTKAQLLKAHKQALNELAMIETSNQNNAKELRDWNELLAQDSRQQIDEIWLRTSKKVPSSQLDRTNYSESPSVSGLAAALTNQKVKTHKLSFRGTFSEMQKFLVELEYHMPHLCLNSLRAKPESQSGLTNAVFELEYSAWQP